MPVRGAASAASRAPRPFRNSRRPRSSAGGDGGAGGSAGPGSARGSLSFGIAAYTHAISRGVKFFGGGTTCPRAAPGGRDRQHAREGSHAAREQGRDHHRRGAGSIINQSSGAAYMHPEYPIEGELPSFHYSVTKAAMNAMTHYMAGSVGRYNIRVNAIAPGPTMTEATRQGVPAQFLDLIINFQMAIHRALDPDDLTGTAVWLASDDAKMVTGQVIPVDGGMIMLG